MSVSDAFDSPMPRHASARQVWELRQQVRALAAERDELAAEVAELRGQLIVAYQRLVAGQAGTDTASRLLRLVCEEAARIRLDAVRYARQRENEGDS
jgi:cell division protein FtsB